MNLPLVCAVMITNNRPELAARASVCFRDQSYGPKRLLVLDSNVNDILGESTVGNALIKYCMRRLAGLSIGALRNVANMLAIEEFNPDILINWDDDDVSHPNRIASQVEQLQQSKAPAVGYQDLLWWDSAKGKAWLYENGSRHYCLGTSLCYWPETWNRNPFPDSNIGEWPEGAVGQYGLTSFVNGEPMIIGEWHGKNGSNGGTTRSETPWKIGGECWKRKPEWDERLRERMALETTVR